MRASKTLKIICAASVAAVCVFTFTACSEASSSSGSSAGAVTGLTGGVAATVNGIDVNEDDITIDIENLRTKLNATDQDAWGNWLSSYSLTPETLRQSTVDNFVNRILVKQAAEENNISVDSSTIDEYVNQIKSNYADDAAWQEALKTNFTDESSYRDQIELSLMEKGLKEKVVPEQEPDSATMLQYAQAYAETYNGAKRSSHILFEAGDQATAQEVLDKINSGELDFAEAAKEYSKDSTASKGGDVGWDKLNNFVTQYTDALSALSKGQVSGLVTSDFGIHIIKCTDEFVAPETVTDVNQLPEDFVTSIKTSLESSSANTAFSTWFEKYKEGASIQVNDMPANVPYAIDMSQYAKDDSENGGNQSNIEVTPSESDNAATEEELGDATESSDPTAEAPAAEDQPTEEQAPEAEQSAA